VNKHEHLMEGVCSRLDGLQAAILSAKLPHLDSWTRARQERAATYDELLGGVAEITTPKIRAGATHVFHNYVLRAARRDQLQVFLKEQGVETTRHYPVPLPFLRAYAYLGHTPADFPVVAQHAREIISLPVYPELSADQQRYVAEKIKEFYVRK
jgi:dTDP-4-amino-4,6-dideoxygalactose transaminase